MANQKLTDLTAATTPLEGTEQVYLVQGGVSKRATAQQMADLPGEWSADTVSQAEAEAGTATTRRAWTALRVAQAIAAWWAASSAKTKLDGVATGATENQTDAYLLSRANHTGTQAAGTITGLATVATSGSASDLETGTLPAARLPATTVSAGSYTNASITVGADGRITAASTGAASAAYRSSSSVTTSSIAQGASGTATITLPRSCIATSITSDKAGWLRLYNSAAAATGDANRGRATDPTAGSGVLLEVIFAATGTITLSPPASVLNAESTPGTTYTIAFANDGTTGTATLTINYLLLEV